MDMKRRSFLKNAGLVLVAGSLPPAHATLESSNYALSTSSPDGSLTGASQGFSEIRHRHLFKIPIEILRAPPLAGFSARSSEPLVGHTDFEGLRHRINAEGKMIDVSQHTHVVTLTQTQLIDLRNGKHVLADLSKFSHMFYFVADDRTMSILRKTKGSVK